MKQLLQRKHSKRIIVFALLLTMLAWLAPANAGVVRAAGSDTKIPVDGGYLLFDKTTGTITGYGGDIKDVIIPAETSDGDKITAIGDEAFEECSCLTSVSISDGVTRIGRNAFYYCSSLSSVSIPNSVTTIEFGAFYGSSLSSVNIPESVTYIGKSAFGGSSGLTTIAVGAGNQNYSSQDGVLFDKAKKELIEYPRGNKRASYEIPSSVTTIGPDAFYRCSELSSVSIPNSTTTIGNYAFARCSKLSSVSIPDSVTTIGDGAFYYCGSLTSVSIPNSVTSIGVYAFAGCSSLSSVSIPASVTYIRACAFYDCSSLDSINIPASVTTIAYCAFLNCSSLSSVTIPDSVTDIREGAFGYYGEDRDSGAVLQSQVPNFKIYGYSNDSAAAKYAKENGFDYAIVGSEGTKPGDGNQGGNSNNQNSGTINKGNNAQNNVSAATAKTGSTVNDKKSNGSYIVTQAKQNGGTVTYKTPLDKKKSSVTIPATVKISGKAYKVTAIEKNAFKGNKKLKTVKIGSNIEKIGANAFNKCVNLKKVTIPSKVKTIQKGAFANCKNLKSVTIQTKKLTKKTVGAGAFKGVNGKATVKVPKDKAKAYKTLLRSKGLSKKAKVK